TSGICWIIGSLSVFVRDIRHMMALGLSAWMYATPIVYPATALPEPVRFLLWINPMAGIVTDYRRCLLDGLPPDWPHFAIYAIAGLILFVIGLNFFEKTQKTFADVM
ncbi:MAG: ABC transporter permease, partial [Candidatus Obscuribacterales bacterium]|nr:ABC transporter permease [Candidatus Obscuribacterales bacterium]